MAKKKTIKDTPNTDPTPIEVNIGASGTIYSSGFFNISDVSEYVTELKGDRALRTYNKMRKSDPQVALALLALKHPIINANWTIEPALKSGDDDKPTPKEKEAVDFLKEVWFDADFKWESILRQALSFFWAGFSIFEKVYTYDEKTGYIKPVTLAQRLQDTIVEWDVVDEKLIAVKQYISAGKTARQVWIPASKLCLFVFDQEGGDFRGQSVLRAAYKPWYYKDTLERIDAMRIERWALGIPKISQTEDIVSNPNKTQAIEAVKNLRAHEKGFLYVPKGFDIDLLDSGSGKMVDPTSAIQRHDASILKAIMAQFLELGQTETGARSLGETLKDMYLMGLSFSANLVCEVIRTQVFKELVAWNFGADVRVPRLKFSGLQPVDLELLSRAYAQISNSKAITMDGKTEDHIREQLGLPSRDMDEVNEDPYEDDSKVTPEVKMPEDPEMEDSEEEQTQEPMKNKQPRRARFSESISPVAVGVEMDTYIHFWRPLTKNEENVALREIVGRVDDTRERLVRITRTARKKVINELLTQAQVAFDSRDPLAAQKMDYTNAVQKELIDDVMPLVKELIEFGYDNVVREIAKQQNPKFATGPELTADEVAAIMKKYFKAQALQFSEKTLDIIVDRFRISVANAIRSGKFDVSTILNDVEAISENTIRRFGGGLLNDAFAYGRKEAAAEFKKEISYVEYSAILDSGTCDQCYSLDGQRFEFDSPEYLENSPPNPRCDSTASGYNLCRCIWVYVANDESAPQA